MSRAPITVTVTLRIDVNPEQWELAYGKFPSLNDLRADVRSYVGGVVESSPPACGEGGITAVKVVDPR